MAERFHIRGFEDIGKDTYYLREPGNGPTN